MNFEHFGYLYTYWKSSIYLPVWIFFGTFLFKFINYWSTFKNFRIYLQIQWNIFCDKQLLALMYIERINLKLWNWKCQISCIKYFCTCPLFVFAWNWYNKRGVRTVEVKTRFKKFANHNDLPCRLNFFDKYIYFLQL